jgi:DNA-binding response OmpR family regulator
MGYKLLLADDSITIQKVVELILSEQDYLITSVSNGEEAFETAKRDKPDIILADIIMPKSDGYQLCEKIKKDPDLMSIPVLLLAGAYESFDTSKASAVGADDYIIKPFESQELIKKVRDCIERGAKPIPEGEVVVGAQEDDLWLSLDLTSKAEVAEEALLSSIETEEEAIGEVLGEELAEEKVIAPEPFEGIMAEEKAEEVELVLPEEEGFPFEAELTEEAPEVMVFPEERKGVTVEPISAEILKEEISRITGKTLKEAFSSITPDTIRAELSRSAEGLFRDALPMILQEIGKIIKETLSTTLDATLKDIVEKVSWEVIPDVAERVTKEIIEASITSGFKDAIEKVAWEVVPDMAEILITKEIERLKAE